MFSTLTFVTGNPDKLREARQILGVELAQADLRGLEEIQAVDVEAAIRHKAHEAYARLKAPLIVEDTGLAFMAWNGLPGALVKWFLETVGNKGLLAMLAGFTDRRALAQCFIAYHDGAAVTVVKGEIAGTIADDERGEGGFGWDRIFVPDGHTCTFAEMTAEEKNACSHRQRAFEALRAYINKR
ncbi:MAG: RdgB/HAM1 family non-canonical purine NTP pyrophosphatase [Nitrospinae bacterium]|nr:RdgB/HAM1 family non-canonical purine NTP pyrophosphatase [Nitrospinota bacterium]